VETLRGKHPGETCWIVGKGPSLEHLKAEHIGEGPVIAINQAILSVDRLGLPNAVYSMQKDANGPYRMGKSWVEPLPGDTLLVHRPESSWFCFPGHKPRVEWDNTEHFGLVWCCPSITSAIEMAWWYGCDSVVLLCMDASVNGDSRTCMMANGVHTITGKDSGYALHLDMALKVARDRSLPLRWVIPEAPCPFAST
jgi:hypothetical protein